MMKLSFFQYITFLQNGPHTNLCITHAYNPLLIYLKKVLQIITIYGAQRVSTWINHIKIAKKVQKRIMMR
jgi:hypothetical protein